MPLKSHSLTFDFFLVGVIDIQPFFLKAIAKKEDKYLRQVFVTLMKGMFSTFDLHTIYI